MDSVENDSQRTLQVYPFINCFNPDEAVTSQNSVFLFDIMKKTAACLPAEESFHSFINLCLYIISL